MIIKKILFLLLALAPICSCSLYKSEGRKTFETQSPGQIRSLSLIGCKEIHSQAPAEQVQAEIDSYDDSPLTPAYESQWTPDGHEVRVREFDQKIHAQVDFVNKIQMKTCTYEAANRDSWLSSRENFFAEVDALILD